MERIEESSIPEENMTEESEEYIVVDYDVFYTSSEHDPELKEGWYFWFIDQDGEIVSEPIGPWDSVDAAMRSGKVAVLVYYDEE